MAVAFTATGARAYSQHSLYFILNFRKTKQKTRHCCIKPSIIHQPYIHLTWQL